MQSGAVDLGVPRGELVGWTVLAVLLGAAAAADLRWGSGAVAMGCIVVLVLVVGSVSPAVVGRVVLHPEGHLTVRSLLGSARWEMEQIDSAVVATAGPELEGSARFGQAGIMPFLRGAGLVLFSGADVPLPSTQVLPLPPLRRRLDRQIAAVQAWLDEGPA